MKARSFAALRMTAIACLFSTPALPCETLEVKDAWIREAPPGAAVMAGYATLHNSGKQPITLDGVRSPDFDEAEIHEMKMEGGQMRMRNAPRIAIDADSTVALEPGDLHIMLFNPKRALKAGDHATIRFDCGKRSRAVDFPVRAEN